MADNRIDKGLPNTRTELKIPPVEDITEVDVTEEQIKQPVEVTPEDDGGATIDFEPGSINIPGTESHFDNLADILPDEILDTVGKQYKDYLSDYEFLINLNTEFENRFKILINTALDVAKDVEGGDTAKVAERVGTLLEKIKFSNDLIVGDINEEDQSGIRGDFITPNGIGMYIYRAPDGTHYAIPKDKQIRLLKPPLRLSSEQVEKILTKSQ